MTCQPIAADADFRAMIRAVGTAGDRARLVDARKVVHLIAMSLVVLLALPLAALAQGIMVSPVNVQMTAGQMAAVLTVGNQGQTPISFQVRPYSWQQTRTGDELLTPTDELLASPPLATVAPGASQIVRLVLRRPPAGHEATYRILVDELPPPSGPRQVRVALRLSIPVFAEPNTGTTPHVQWSIATQGGQVWLIAVNDGTQHQTVREIALHTADGRVFKVESKAPPHILAGGTFRWRVQMHGPPPPPGTVLQLTASADYGSIDQPVRVDERP